MNAAFDMAASVSKDTGSGTRMPAFLEGAVRSWKRASDARLVRRSDENREALYAATRAQRDALRDLRRDRKAFEAARDEVKWWNVMNGERRAARAVVRDSRELAGDAKAARRQAKADYPMTLEHLAVRWHAAHLIPTSVWSTMDSLAGGVALGTSVTAIAANIALAVAASRIRNTATVDADLEALRPSQEERDLLQRLSPKVWAGVAEPRGLSDVLASGATLTPSGIQVKLTLQNSMTLDKLAKMDEQLRAALRLREKTRLELRPGSTGGHARMTLRTRSAAEGADLSGWKPGDPWGINTVTGENVYVPLGRRMMVAGTSGAGKSWSMRSVLAEASAYDDHAVVVIDAKRVEALNWQHRARTAVTKDEILDVTDELVAEMHDRLEDVPRGKDVIEISPSRPRITVFVDEGAEAIALSKDEGRGEDKVEYSRIIENLRTLARMARAAEIILLWATQKPTLSGAGNGLDSQIAGQITCRASFAVSTQTEARVVFGDDAIEKGWLAHELPMPGVAMLRDGNTAKPHHIKTRAFSPADVIALPDHTIWSRRNSSTGATKADIAARKALEAQPDPWEDVTVEVPLAGAEGLSGATVKVSAADRDDQLIELLTLDPCKSMSELARLSGASKSVVKRSLERMEADGLVRRDDEGCWWVCS